MTNSVPARLVAAWNAVALILAVLLFIGPTQSVADEPPFRTDGGDEKLPWYRVVPGRFPPEESAHAFAGELIAVDAVHRAGALRLDRTDAQRRGDWDLPLNFSMLPYGAIWYHGAPAELRDIPLGTHLHGRFYQTDPQAGPPPRLVRNRKSTEDAFTQAFALEDDFSFHARQGRAWRVETFDRAKQELTVTGVATATGAADAKPTTLRTTPATRVWVGDRIGTLDDVSPGQTVQVNLTWATLFGPGRCLDVWVDETSRQVATARQRAIHHQFQRERGLAGYVTAVDNGASVVTVSLFDIVDPELIAAFKTNSSVTLCVAEPTLQSYDQLNDRKDGPLLEVRTVPGQPGSAGVELVCRPSMLLEGFRPGRVVRAFPREWPVTDLPLEERLWPERD